MNKLIKFFGKVPKRVKITIHGYAEDILLTI